MTTLQKYKNTYGRLRGHCVLCGAFFEEFFAFFEHFRLVSV